VWLTPYPRDFQPEGEREREREREARTLTFECDSAVDFDITVEDIPFLSHASLVLIGKGARTGAPIFHNLVKIMTC